MEQRSMEDASISVLSLWARILWLDAKVMANINERWQFMDGWCDRREVGCQLRLQIWVDVDRKCDRSESDVQ